MKMSDLAPGNRLHCGSEMHPAHVSRDTMYFLTHKDDMFVFGCKLCTEINRMAQIHVVSKDHQGQEIYRNTRKAEHIDRNERGQIVSFR